MSNLIKSTKSKKEAPEVAIQEQEKTEDKIVTKFGRSSVTTTAEYVLIKLR